MPRKPLIRSKILPYHVTLRCNNREWFQLPMEQVWELMSWELYRITVVCGARIHAFVLMSNHLHLLVSTPELDIGQTMAEFGKSVTKTFNRISGRSGHLFGGRYRSSIIRSPLYYANALKYVYRNPVRAGMVERVEDYRYSSLAGLLGTSNLQFPVHYPEPERLGLSFVPFENSDLLNWLNEPFRTELQEALDRGFKREVFDLPEEPALIFYEYEID